ncbi:MobA/MobL family protein [Undibacterium jejuense]|uniref:MobA/MobL family protein n=1 Tax=Undibacterium jejuense TaxID=1344949 RepID=A0A923HJ76_9BURK|nr:MobA/MobL family protein [Undibacterium jejuense]
MAIYHLSVKTVSRSAGRSATAAAAYRAGEKISDERTGEMHDFTRKAGVESVKLILPVGAPNWASDRAALWNAVERAENRKNSTVAREFEIALPEELSLTERNRLAHDFASEIVERHGCIADVAIHAPGKLGDNRNHHAHILLSTRRLGPDGFYDKTRELDDLKTGSEIVTQWRERFAVLQNERLIENGISTRVDHRSLEAQGINREPTKHVGPAASSYERRTGELSRKRMSYELDVMRRLTRAKETGELERKANVLDEQIVKLETNIAAAIVLRDKTLMQQKMQRGNEGPLSLEALRAKSRLTAATETQVQLNSGIILPQTTQYSNLSEILK